jgi:hypothetical protein
MFGSERVFKRPQESAIIQGQERAVRNSVELINSQAARAKEALETNTVLVNALRGEKAFNTIKLAAHDDEKIELALGVIKKVPFITKQIPDHLAEPQEQAGFLVAVVEADVHGKYIVQ